ncbi:MAG: SseB family protein, partial [Actinobacteria bacterium]|nr:SseB family protein [Actinomycetota bacterium]
MSWQNEGQPRDPGDDGSADPGVAAALAAYAAGEGSEHAALTALARSRLLVPIVAVVSGGAPATARGPGHGG